MVSRSPMLVTLWKSWRQNWQNAIWWAICTLAGGLMPLWATLFIRRTLERPFGLEDFVVHGDLVLYAAAFLAPAIYQVAVRMKNDTSRLGVGAVTTASLALVFSAIVYTVVSPDLVPGGIAQHIHDYTFLNSVSYGLLLLAFFFSVCVFLNEQQLEFEDLEGAEKIDQKILSTRLGEHKPESANAAFLVSPPGADETEVEETLAEKFTEDNDG